MHIAIDARAWGWAGVGRYTRNLIKHLAQLPTKHVYTILLSRENQPNFELQRQNFPHPNMFRTQAVESSYYTWQEQLLLWRQLERVKADLYHFTHFNLPLLFRRPYVVTIHDSTRFYFPGQRKKSLFQQLAYEQVFQHAVVDSAKVITVSKAAANDLFSLPLKKRPEVEIIHEGVEDRFQVEPTRLERTKVRMYLGTRKPYLLYVGVWLDHKNLARLLKSFALIKAEEPELLLVMTGKPVPQYSQVIKMVNELGIKDSVIFAGFVPDSLLPSLLAESRCLLIPSLYEGFGLPALEAAAVGTPVLASNVTSLPEILPEAAEFVNPEFIPDMVAGIRRLLTDESHRLRLIKLAQARAKEFSWLEVAQKHENVYEQARAGKLGV